MNLYYILGKMNAIRFLNKMGIYNLNLVDPTSNIILRTLVDLVCQKMPWITEGVIEVLSDRTPSLIDIHNMGKYLTHYPAGASLKNFDHFFQMIREDSGLFRKYNYGVGGNFIKYGQESPPTYDISEVIDLILEVFIL